MTTSRRQTEGQAEGVATYLQVPHRLDLGPLATPQRVLAIGAHPDDVELAAGATLARWVRHGAATTVLVATDGRGGTWDPALDPAELAARRATEAAAAAHLLGASLVLLAVPDGTLAKARILAWRLAFWIRQCRPDVVLTHDPVHPGRLHPDHRALGEAVLEALAEAREPARWPWLAPAHRPKALLLFETPAPNHAELVAPEDLATKARILAAHQSQYATTYGIHPGDDPHEVLLRRLRARADADGASLGLPQAAEVFRRLDDL